MNKIVITIIVVFFTLIPFVSIPIHAQNLDTCDFFPCADSQDDGDLDQDVNTSIEDAFSLLTSLVFVAIMALGIYLIVRGAFEIVKSEGDVEQVEQGYQRIKGVYVGIIMLIVGLIGLVIVVAFFNGSGIFGSDVEDPSNEFNLPFV